MLNDQNNHVIDQSIPTAPSAPRATAGHLRALSVPGVGHLQILCCSGARHLPTPRPFPSFWHARGFLSEYNYTEDFTEKKNKQIGSFVKDGKKLKRFVKACSWFYACISSLLIKPELHGEIWSYQSESTFLVIESNFCSSTWYYLKNILSNL